MYYHTSVVDNGGTAPSPLLAICVRFALKSPFPGKLSAVFHLPQLSGKKSISWYYSFSLVFAAAQPLAEPPLFLHVITLKRWCQPFFDGILAMPGGSYILAMPGGSVVDTF